MNKFLEFAIEIEEAGKNTYRESRWAGWYTDLRKQVIRLTAISESNYANSNNAGF
jgi:hypothetical protein